MIQGVVNRLAHNSFLLKGWTVVLVSAMLALAAGESAVNFVYVAYFPTIVFWGLDGYFLTQERLFRKLYDYVRELPEDQVDFSMDTSKVSEQVASWLKVTLSKTLIVFHGVITIAITIITIINLS